MDILAAFYRYSVNQVLFAGFEFCRLNNPAEILLSFIVMENDGYYTLIW